MRVVNYVGRLEYLGGAIRIFFYSLIEPSRCFSFVRDWVEKKIRRHLMRARQRRGFGWRRWSKRWLYEGLGLFNGYRVRRYEPRLKASPT